MIIRSAGLAAVALVALAGAAEAQTGSEPTPAPAPATISASAIDLSGVRDAARVTYAQAAALQAAGIVRTSVDRGFTGGGLSLGFLCGLQPAYYHAGAADARGYDPQGKFVGAKLAFAFK